MNDTATTYYKPQDPLTSYSTRNYGIEVFASSSYKSNNPSKLARICNALTHAINGCIRLPQLVLVVLEDDVIKDVTTRDEYLLKDFTRRVKWLMSEFRKTMDASKDAVQANAKMLNQPSFVWILPTKHKNFINNYPRRKFGQAIETAAKLTDNVAALRLVQNWDYEDGNLYLCEQQRFTSDGKAEFWRAVDKTVEYYDTKYVERKPHSDHKEGKTRASNSPKHSHRGLSGSRRENFSNHRQESRYKLPAPPARRY